MTDSTGIRPVVLHARVVTGAGGGPEKTILNSPRYLKDLGYDSVCAYMHPPGDDGFKLLQQRAQATGAEVASVPDRGFSDWRTVRRLLTLCRERNVSIWHGHDYKSDAIGLLLRRWHPMHLVSTVHGWVTQTWKTPIYYGIDRWCLRHHDRVICVSDELFAECMRSGVPAAGCSVIDNAIDLSGVNVARLDDGERSRILAVPIDRPVIGTVGRFSGEKGFDRLILAVDELLRAGIPVSLVIAGDGPEESELQRLIEELGREREIRLLGHQPDPSLIYRSIDVFAMSSRSEGLPNVLLEALAHRLPVVATTVGGIPGVLRHGENGLLVEPDSVSALSEALTRVLHEDGLRETMAIAGRETVESRYSFAYRMKRVVAVYDDVLGRCDGEGSGENREPGVDCDAPLSLTLSSEGERGLPRPSHARGASFSPSPPWGRDGGRRPEEGGTATLAGVETQSSPAALTSPHRKTNSVTTVELTSNPVQWDTWLAPKSHQGFYQRPAWLRVLNRGLQQQPVFLQAKRDGQLVGVLPLAFVQSRLFGRFLVSLPYLNSVGVVADDEHAARALVDRAVRLADEFDVKNLELRHETPVDHPRLTSAVTEKVHMRLALPASAEELWDSIRSKVRNQVRKAQKNDALSVEWGRQERLDDFYDVFCRNMRDLGTPPFSRKLFRAILDEFPADAEIACVRLNGQTIASGLLVHGPGVTEVPSASSLRKFNATNANMLLYWHLLTRAIERGQQTFDFGRSTRGGGTYRFKAQWGAVESPAVWQHYVRQGQAADMRPSSGRFDQLIRIWQRLPVWVTKIVGPGIVRGIP